MTQNSTNNTIIAANMTRSSSMRIGLERLVAVFRATVAYTAATSHYSSIQEECTTMSISSKMVDTSKKARRIVMRIKLQRLTTRRIAIRASRKIDGKTRGRRPSISSSGTKAMQLIEAIKSSNSSSITSKMMVDSIIRSMARIRTMSIGEETTKALIRAAIRITWAITAKMVAAIKMAISTIAHRISSSSITMAATMTHRTMGEVAVNRSIGEWATTSTATMTDSTISMITKIIRKMSKVSHSKISSGTPVTSTSRPIIAHLGISQSSVMHRLHPRLCRKAKISSAAADKVAR